MAPITSYKAHYVSSSCITAFEMYYLSNTRSPHLRGARFPQLTFYKDFPAARVLRSLCQIGCSTRKMCHFICMKCSIRYCRHIVYVFICQTYPKIQETVQRLHFPGKKHGHCIIHLQEFLPHRMFETDSR